MKILWIGAFAICTLAPLAVAQRGGGAPGGGVGFHGGGKGFPIGTTGGQSSGWVGIPPIGLPQVAPIGGIQRGGNGSGYGYGGMSYGYGGGYGYPSYDGGYEQSPQVMMLPVNVILPEPPPPPPPPPEPARPVMSVYHWADTATPSANSFAIVHKNGQVRYAIAVWPQDGMLCYTDPAGSTVRIAFTAIDREATEKVNAERGLKLWLANRR